MDKMGQTEGLPPDGILYTGSREELLRKLRARDDRITKLETAVQSYLAAVDREIIPEGDTLIVRGFHGLREALNQ